ncbi:MAG: DUF445 domain-containing protein [Pseudomonadota bacterium]|nr:DUF445 domain-containing protein [Pseudomonadota bacterium]
MNKSLITNITTLLITIYGYFSPVYSVEIIMAGLFGLSGGLTNWLAIHMLFEKVPFLLGSGVIPLRFKEFKEGIKDLIMHEFFSSKSMENFFTKKKSSTKKFIEEIDYDKIFARLIESIQESSLGSMLEVIGGIKALEPLREPLKNKIRDSIEELSMKHFEENNQSSENLRNEIESLIDARLSELSPEQIKIIVKDIIHKHLGWLVVWGGVFGFLIGLILGFLGSIN